MSAKLKPTEDRVDPRVKRTRQLLLKAFEELLVEKSLETITVQDIADRATVNRATFYAHFEDKYDLLDHTLEEMFAQLLHKNLPPDAKDNPTNLLRLIQAICQFLELLHNRCSLSTGTQLDMRLEQGRGQHLQDLFAPWAKQAGNGARSRVDAELRATVAGWAVYGACLFWSRKTWREPAEEFAGQVLPLVLPILDLDNGAVTSASPSKATSGIR